VQASQEVVRIPKDILTQAGDTLEVRVRATKRHKVRSALLFSATPKPLKTTPLTVTKATHRRDKKDYQHSLTTKNNSFVHTIPGDVVDVVVKDIPRLAVALCEGGPRQENHTRRYLLKANGFYTKMSLGTRYQLGSRWLSRLSSEDRALLRRLKVNAV
jgi:hypothetical protein